MDTRNDSVTPKFRGKSTKRGERRKASAPKNHAQRVAREIVYKKTLIEEPPTKETEQEVQKLQKKPRSPKAKYRPRREKMQLNRQLADENAEEASEAKERS